MADCDDAPTRRRRTRLTIEQGDDALCPFEEEARRRRRRKKKKRLDPPFHVLVIQVGTVVFILCFVTFYLWQSLYSDSSSDEGEGDIGEAYDDDVSLKLDMEEEMAAGNQEPTQAPTKPTAPPLPVWDLGQATQFDAFGIAATHSTESDSSEKRRKNQAFWTTTASLRNQFAETYGGENAVRAMMERGLTVFPLESDSSNSLPSDLVHTACRIRLAKEESRPFKITFGGYSVTVGRGNYFGQSFPFVMKRLLDTPFQLLGINLSVKNAAIGG